MYHKILYNKILRLQMECQYSQKRNRNNLLNKISHNNNNKQTCLNNKQNKKVFRLIPSKINKMFKCKVRITITISNPSNKLIINKTAIWELISLVRILFNSKLIYKHTVGIPKTMISDRFLCLFNLLTLIICWFKD